MLKPKKLQKGDKVAIISLSSGILGSPFCKHELAIALTRLEEMGLVPVVMPNALKGVDFIKNHPEARAQDLKDAFLDDSIKGIICAIGGDDTYKTIPYLMEDEEFKEAVRNHPKIFTGFSDTTNNHIMLNKLGLSTYYGPCIVVDFAELDKEMLPYTKEQFLKFFSNDSNYEIVSSPIWYKDRENFGEEEIGKPRLCFKETHGYEVLNGSGIVTGKLYGGCIESFYDDFTGERYGEEQEIFEKYQIFPTNEEWQEKILFLETSEEEPTPEKLEKMLLELKKRNILKLVKGVIVGKPHDEKFYEEYKEVYKKVFEDLDTPVLYNVNFGHGLPRCILPYDASTTIDYDQKKIIINSSLLDKEETHTMKK